ncbi:Pectinesterase [Heracleum sosnowskyi]|uniref:Pectinesterase n=1 Tax=Heracleum sosnowskyi TaxID=360622 RepID=A0AAD8IEA4_9APIA|nr:Pectinesterase [Heracleum sosnowskyi]
MASKFFSKNSPALFLALALSFMCFSSMADKISICDSTPYPSSCISSVPTNYNTNNTNVSDFCQFSIRKSMSNARKFKSLIENYQKSSSELSTGVIRALEDCHLLADLNMDFLASSLQSVSTKALSSSKADDVQTLLSSILTNTQTCLDGLQETASTWNQKNGISTPLANDNKLFSVSLSLFKKGWGHKLNQGPSNPSKKQHAGFKNRRLPLKMSSKSKALFEQIGRRKLLQTDDGSDELVTISDLVIVSKDGSGNFTTINEAVARAPNNSLAVDGYFLIYVVAGLYEEYVSIPKNKKHLMMIGDGINQTVITGNHNVVDGWTTFSSPTFAVVGQGFVGVNITFRNTAGGIKHQAVAVRNGADMSTFYSCSFEGYQDTLYVHSQRQYYTECDIYGTVDFIFGNAAAVFQNCNIYPRLPLANQFNAITAQGRIDPNQNTGISIQNCNIKAADDLASSDGTTQTYLGRPWKQYSRTIYIQSFMDSLINPAGWREWSGDFALSTLYYAELGNMGPGSVTTERVTWPGYHKISAKEAANFTVSNFLLGDDWLPQTGVPYSGSL